MRASEPPLPFATRPGRDMPVTALAIDYGPKDEIHRHQHDVCQLIYGVHGVMVVSTMASQWIVPATRAVWIPANVEHGIRMVGRVGLRTLYIQPAAARSLPKQCAVVAVSVLMRELILEATAIALPYHRQSRDGRLMRLILDEIVQMKSLPLSLPFPNDPRLRIINESIARQPYDETTTHQWAQKLGVDPKTIQRLFLRETGLTFGKWRQQARLLKALELLAKGERILEIALAVGYGSPSAFSTMFQRQLGTPPSSYFQNKTDEHTQGSRHRTGSKVKAR
jgi:AraC-like DNA-binding protein